MEFSAVIFGIVIGYIWLELKAMDEGEAFEKVWTLVMLVVTVVLVLGSGHLLIKAVKWAWLPGSN
jgi:hypothetical protein